MTAKYFAHSFKYMPYGLHFKIKPAKGFINKIKAKADGFSTNGECDDYNMYLTAGTSLCTWDMHGLDKTRNMTDVIVNSSELKLKLMELRSAYNESRLHDTLVEVRKDRTECLLASHKDYSSSEPVVAM